MATTEDNPENEWEDVLLCSYTPFGENCFDSAKLSETRLQKLKSSARLVVTQIITMKENLKLNPQNQEITEQKPNKQPQENDDDGEKSAVDHRIGLINVKEGKSLKPTILDALFEAKAIISDENSCFLGKSTVYPGGFLGAIGNRIVQLDGAYNVKQMVTLSSAAYNLAEIGPYIASFRVSNPVRFYKDGQLVHESTAKFNGYASRFTAVTKDYVYFRTETNSVVAIDADFKETTAVAKQTEVFVVTSNNKVLSLHETTNDGVKWELCKGGESRPLPPAEIAAQFSKSSRLSNPTISLVLQKYVAVAANLDGTQMFLHRLSDLSFLGSVAFATHDQIYNIRVGSVKHAIIPLVMRGSSHFHAVGIVGTVPHYLCCIPVGKHDAFSLGSIGKQWMFGGYGRLTSFVLRFD